MVDNDGFNLGDDDRDNMLDTDEAWLYSSETVLTYHAQPGPYANKATVQAHDASTGLPADPDTDSNHHFGGQAVLDIEKAINAADPINPTDYEDADFPTGPILPIGTEVVWTYLVTNRGNVPIDMIGLIDDFGTDDRTDDFFPVPVIAGATYVGDDDENGILDPGETWLFTSEGQLDTADPRVNADGNYVVVQGQYANLAGVGVQGFGVDMVSFDTILDSDRNHHFGTPPGVTVQKSITTTDQTQVWSVTDLDADSPDLAAIVPEGAQVFWNYRVTNQGDLPLTISSLTDNAGTLDTDADDFTPAQVLGGGGTGPNIGDTNGDGVFDPDETWVFTSQGVVTYLAKPGLYENVASVIATDGANELRDDDLNYHFGADPDVRVEKALNAIDPFNPTSIADGDFPPGPEVLDGTDLVWTYQVINTGNIAIDITSLTDDAGTPGTTPTDTADDFTPAAVVDAHGFNLGDTDADNVFDPGETWLFTSQGVVSYQAQLGQYVNRVVVEAIEPVTQETVSDDDRNHHFGGDTAEGLTPGFWKNNADKHGASQWPRGTFDEQVYTTDTRFGEVFDVPADPTTGEPLYPIAFTTLLQALGFGDGGVFALARHAVAALLNATHIQVAYPWTPPQIVDAVNAALASGDPALIESVKDQLDALNNIGGGLDQQVAKVDAADATAGETDGTVFVTLTLSEVETEPVSISYETADGTAVAGRDYDHSSGTVIFAPGDKSKQVPITLINDPIYESSETFFLNLIAPIGVQIGRNPAKVTIGSDDPQPVLTVGVPDNHAVESETNPAVFVVNRSANAHGDVSVTVDFTGTASPADYTLAVDTAGTWNALTGLLTLPDGVDTATFTIDAIDDGNPEPDETVVLTLAGPTGAALGSPASGTATIADLPGPTLSVLDTTVTEGDTGGFFIDVQVVLSAPLPTTVTVVASTQDATATAGDDYVSESALLTFAANTTTARPPSTHPQRPRPRRE